MALSSGRDEQGAQKKPNPGFTSTIASRASAMTVWQWVQTSRGQQLPSESLVMRSGRLDRDTFGQLLRAKLKRRNRLKVRHAARRLRLPKTHGFRSIRPIGAASASI